MAERETDGPVTHGVERSEPGAGGEPAEGGGSREDKKLFGIGLKRISRILTGSFIVVMFIHIAVFTAIGLFTPAEWRLLWIFLGGLGIMLLVVMPLKYLRKRKRVVKGKTDHDK